MQTFLLITGIIFTIIGLVLRGSSNKKYVVGFGLIVFLTGVAYNGDVGMLLFFVGFVMFLFGVIQFLISLKRKDYRKRAKLLVFTGIALFVIGMTLSIVYDNEDAKQADATEDSQEENEASEEESNVAEFSIEDSGIDNENQQRNIVEAFEKIGASPSDLKKFDYIGNWIGGDVLSTNYKNNRLEVYINGDDTVNSINIGESKIYEEGYEPLIIDEYIVSMDDISELQTVAERSVKENLSNPNTANFAFLGWGYGRTDDIYLVSGNLTAKNSLGVENELDFYIEYEKNGDTLTTRYFILDGEQIVGKNSVVEATKTPLAANESSSENTNSIELSYNSLGDYGVEITDNQMPVIFYDLPEGEYNVTTSMNYTVVMVVSKDTHRNSDGNIERETIDRFEVTADSEDIIIDITGSEYITLMVNSKVNFEKNQ